MGAYWTLQTCFPANKEIGVRRWHNKRHVSGFISRDLVMFGDTEHQKRGTGKGCRPTEHDTLQISQYMDLYTSCKTIALDMIILKREGVLDREQCLQWLRTICSYMFYRHLYIDWLIQFVYCKQPTTTTQQQQQQQQQQPESGAYVGRLEQA